MDALCALSVYVPSPKHFGNPDYDRGPTLPSLESQPKNTNALGSSKGAYCVPRLTWKRLMRVNFAMRYLVKARVKSGRAGTLANNLVAEVKPQIVSQIWSRPPSRVRC
jgi:hypothetical protein